MTSYSDQAQLRPSAANGADSQYGVSQFTAVRHDGATTHPGCLPSAVATRDRVGRSTSKAAMDVPAHGFWAWREHRSMAQVMREESHA